jgi:ArsR family metal-binding transcriptional regulator
MLLKSYTKEIFRPECNHSFESLHCFAHLEEDVGEVLPYLNAVLGGYIFTQDPPSVTFKVHGKLVAVHPRKIAVNALKDEEEATKIIEWMKREINSAWEKRADIQPSYTATPGPQVFEILKMLPKTNCKECGLKTCMVFASQVAEGVRGPRDCPPLDEAQMARMEEYLSPFHLDF